MAGRLHSTPKRLTVFATLLIAVGIGEPLIRDTCHSCPQFAAWSKLFNEPAMGYIALVFPPRDEGESMAYKMKLNMPYQGMPHIWNISRHVGVRDPAENLSNDVELVQRLIIERYKVIPSKVPRSPGIGSLSSATGQMDTQTAFDIYWAGDGGKPLRDAETINPARGGNLNYGSGFWTIAYLNFKLFKHAPQVWANLPEICSPMLRAELLSKTTP